MDTTLSIRAIKRETTISNNVRYSPRCDAPFVAVGPGHRSLPTLL
jgi:hypothetical protein